MMLGDPPTIQVTSGPTREALRNPRGQIFGHVEHQKLTGRILARDRAGRIVGIYDARANQTRDANGVLFGPGYLLPALMFRVR